MVAAVCPGPRCGQHQGHAEAQDRLWEDAAQQVSSFGELIRGCLAPQSPEQCAE